MFDRKLYLEDKIKDNVKVWVEYVNVIIGFVN